MYKRQALAIGTKRTKTAICSGEGGILQEEFENSYKYIFEYVPNKYSVNDENLKKVSAIEIKIGQGTKPGMGGHLPAEKVTEEIAKVRGKNVHEELWRILQRSGRACVNNRSKPYTDDDR